LLREGSGRSLAELKESSGRRVPEKSFREIREKDSGRRVPVEALLKKSS